MDDVTHEAQQFYKTNGDEQKKEPPTFKIGDQVWLIRCHIQSQQFSNILDYNKIGPFTIIKKSIQLHLNCDSLIL